MFEIEKSIPIPTRRRGGQRGETKYPWADMKIGDSFSVPARGPTKTRQQDLAQNTLATSARYWAIVNQKNTFKVTTRLSDDRKFVRCWRTA